MLRLKSGRRQNQDAINLSLIQHKGAAMTPARKMLLESLVGHLALLEKANPRKAASPVARRTKQFVRMSLRDQLPPRRLAA
jgi:hypothetical protein